MKGGSKMKLPRRNFLHLTAGAAALPAVSRIAWAQAYPTRPVHWIVSFAAGGPNDIVARIVGQYLSDHLGQQFVIENRAGASGNVGMQSALNSASDGYTIAFVGPNYALTLGSTRSSRLVSSATACRSPA
jgi:tripartite-type tricarboxylate transporter receptor subunit TctC